MLYPVSDPAEWERYAHLSPLARLDVEWRDYRYRRRVEDLSGTAGLERISGTERPLEPNDIALIVCLKNGRFYLPFFLAHYREMGVTRFIVLDDASDDGTRDILKEELDVDLFTSALDYAASGRGQVWRDTLIARYGRNRWYLCVDIDEFLIYPGVEERGVRAFIEDLERSGSERALAPMIDIYPDGPLSSSKVSESRDFLDLSPLIDGDGYFSRRRKFGLAVFGGPRLRLFDSEMRLTKFPVIFADAATSYQGASIHGPLPFRRNFSAPSAVLLHFKFSANSVAEFGDIVSRGSHFDGSRFYRQMVENEHFGDELDLRYQGSIRIGASEGLVERGFMQDLRKR